MCRSVRLVVKAHKTGDLVHTSSRRFHIVRDETVIGIPHSYARHNDLILRYVRMLSHHVRLHDALTVDHTPEPLCPCSEYQSVCDCASVEMADGVVFEGLVARHHY